MPFKSDKPKPAATGQAGARLPDYLLEPLPLPDVVESDTDTAWGRWEESLKASDNPGQVNPVVVSDTSFGDTLPSALAPMPDFQNTKNRP
jgi:hypothetical protein